MKTVIYLGLELSKTWIEKYPHAKMIHAPMIRIEPRSLDDQEVIDSFQKFELYTHLIITSKIGANLLFEALSFFGIPIDSHKTIIAVGQATSESIQELGGSVAYCAEEESSEGIIKLLDTLDLKNSYFFWPHSNLSRSIIPDYFKRQNIALRALSLYETHFNLPSEELILNLDHAEELIFTSPSTVDAFLHAFGFIPWQKKITAIGPITQARLQHCAAMMSPG